MNIVNAFINDEVIDLKARSATDYESVFQGKNQYQNGHSNATDEKSDLTDEMKRLEFKWNVTDYRTYEIDIQLNFKNKEELS